MKSLLAACALLALGAAAHAQTGETRWRDGSGWSVDVAGWRLTEETGPARLFMAAPEDAGLPAACSAQTAPFERPDGMSDDALKRRAGRFTEVQIQAMAREGESASLALRDVDGVTLAAIHVLNAQGEPLRDMRLLWFYHPTPAGAAQFEIRCIAPMGATPETLALIERLMNSIRFAE